MTEQDRAALYRQTAEKLPVGHVGETAEIAEAYLYLMRQTYGTGQVVVVTCRRRPHGAAAESDPNRGWRHHISE
jgi:hypothetical protein